MVRTHNALPIWHQESTIRSNTLEGISSPTVTLKLSQTKPIEVTAPAALTEHAPVADEVDEFEEDDDEDADVEDCTFLDYSHLEV